MDTQENVPKKNSEYDYVHPFETGESYYSKPKP